MNYTKDLLQIRKKKLLVVLGCTLIVLSIWYIPIKWIEKEPVSILDWCVAAVFLLNGTVQLLHGLGINEERLFGKAYITINDTGLRIKTAALAKEQSVNWNEVSSIHVGKWSVNFLQTNLNIKQIYLSKLDKETQQEVKEAIMAVADKNGIPKKSEE